ncbi:E3 ubiquitin-protein ligase rnf152-like [Myxocyprinus asiaticus]|uniref:E3 ubiquitin-protein ligase rnf152-like n=1 Tax=Myxocyprinus asiaticus TaxID=70543 RepID=UPI002221F0BD|nr:E3 ubiquitin-protein ligase rnf152-like [Myxocyprinus asiaticus]
MCNSHFLRMMETLSQSSMLECQICFNNFSQRRRPKLLHCQHTCCSMCLSQMRLSQREIRCPWCRCITHLPNGISVAHLPDDPEVLSVISLSQSSEHTPIFIHLPNNGCYLLPVPLDTDGALLPGDQKCRFAPKSVGVLNVSDGRSLVLGEEQVEDRMEEEVAVQTTAWTGVCTVLLVAFILIFLLGIVLHNMSCMSKRFTIISCG